MPALPWSDDHPPRPPRPHRAHRRRGDLVPLSDQDGAAGPWFLGADGRTAHLPAPSLTSPTGTLTLAARDVASQHNAVALCKVFLSQIPAGDHAEHCPACLQERSPPTPTDCGIVP